MKINIIVEKIISNSAAKLLPSLQLSGKAVAVVTLHYCPLTTGELPSLSHLAMQSLVIAYCYIGPYSIFFKLQIFNSDNHNLDPKNNKE